MEDFGKMVVRSSFWSFDTLFNADGKVRALAEVTDSFLKDNVFREALFWSSPGLYGTLLEMERSPEKFSAKKKQQIDEALQKYAIRAASRPTPFGIFAGVSLQNFSNDPHYNKAVQRHLIPDAVFLQKMVGAILEDDGLRNQVLFFPNNTLYPLGSDFRFLEILEDQKFLPQISAFEKTEILESVCPMASGKGISFNRFYNSFSEEFSEEELHNFFYELVGSGFLVSELEPILTEADPLQVIDRFLDRVKKACPSSVIRFRDALLDIAAYQKKVEKSRLGEFYLQDYKKLKKYGDNTSSESFFHVSLSLPSPSQPVLSEWERKTVREAVHSVVHLFPKRKENVDLNRFRSLFLERYGTETIPLLSVLDPDIGLGFPANEQLGHKASLFFQEKEKSIPTSEPFWLESLGDKIENHENSRKPIEIGSLPIKKLGKGISLPESFYVLGERSDDGEILIQGIGNGPAYSLLARFSGSSPEIEDFCQEIAEEEQKQFPDRVFADVVWSPEAKITNIVRRISPLDYEIPILYRSSKDGEHQILLEDLEVSVRNDEVILTSKRLKKRIAPRLSNAHHYKVDKNPIYRFLCALQHQKERFQQPELTFGNTKKRYLPRIVYKNIILSPAQWKLYKSDGKKITTAPHPFQALLGFIKKWALPDRVALSEGDRELFLDLSQKDYADILLRKLKKKEPTLLREWLHSPKKDSSLTQFVYPLKNRMIKKEKLLEVKENIKVGRSFPPGSKWLYFKIYCSSDFSDVVLQKVFDEVVAGLRKSGKLKKWFFIRYLAPHYHLRVRFLLEDSSFISQIVEQMNTVLTDFMAQRLVWKIQLDTYERELERYGAAHIVNTETVFSRDSEYFMRALEELKIHQNDQNRRFLGVLNVLNWCSFLDSDLYRQRDFCKEMLERFKQEKSADFINEVKRQYRKDKALFFKSMEYWEKQGWFQNRRDSLENLTLPSENLKSYIHMSVNRWFKSNQREWELLTYYYGLNYLEYQIHKKES